MKCLHSLKSFKIILVIYLFLFFESPVLLQALEPHKKITQYIFDSWKSQYGLPQISIKSILQTSDNYIWLGTPEGLLRFDGVRFTIFMKKILLG